MENTTSTNWLITTVVVTTLFILVLVCIYLWKKGACKPKTKWPAQKAHIRTRDSLDDLQDTAVLVCMLPNGDTIHSVTYLYAPKLREATIKLSKVIPDEYQKNLLSSATTYVSRREGVAEAYLSGYFTGADTVVITASKRSMTDDTITEAIEDTLQNKQSPREGIEEVETTTWWG